MYMGVALGSCTMQGETSKKALSKGRALLGMGVRSRTGPAEILGK